MFVKDCTGMLIVLYWKFGVMCSLGVLGTKGEAGMDTS